MVSLCKKLKAELSTLCVLCLRLWRICRGRSIESVDRRVDELCCRELRSHPACAAPHTFIHVVFSCLSLVTSPWSFCPYCLTCLCLLHRHAAWPRYGRVRCAERISIPEVRVCLLTSPEICQKHSRAKRTTVTDKASQWPQVVWLCGLIAVFQFGVLESI